MEIYLSPDITKEFNISAHKSIKISFGIKHAEVKIQEFKNTAKSFKIPYQVRRLLSFNNELQSFNLFLKGDNTIKIGPVIGIMTSQPVVFMNEHLISLYKVIIKTSKRFGVCCFLFTPENIDFNNKTIWGFTTEKTRISEKEWVLKQFPIPDIVYNRVGFLSNHELQKAYSRFFLRFLKDNVDVKFFNPFGLGDKWKIYNQLKQYNSIKKYLPDTELLNSTDMLEPFLNNYQMVYLKPTDSSLSMGVYRITYLPDGKFNIGYRQKEDNVNKTFKGLQILEDEVKKIISKRPYLIQQGIKLIHYYNRPVDLRVHLFKNQYGVWDVLSVSAKVGSEAAVTSSRHWGDGYRESAEYVLTCLFPSDLKNIIQDIKKPALEIAHYIDKIYSGNFAELGFDMGLDTDKKVYMIEVNPKPNWAVPAHSDKTLLESNLANHLFNYCFYLLNINKTVFANSIKYE